MVAGDTFVIVGAVGKVMDARRSADPERDVDALLPCLAIISRDEARMEAVVLMLNVLWESPPVPTMSTWCVVRVIWPETAWGGDRKGALSLVKSYQAALIPPLFPSSLLNQSSQGTLICHFCSSLAHPCGACRDNIGPSIQAGKVQADEQRRCLCLADLIREEVGNCICYLLWVNVLGWRAWPQALEEWFDVDGWELRCGI